MIIYFFIILVLELVFILFSKIKKDKKYLKIFKGLFFSFFVFMFLYLTADIYLYIVKEISIKIELIGIAIFGIINVLIGLAGFKVKKDSKEFVDTSKKWITIKYILIFSIFSFIIVFNQYSIKYKENEKNRIESKIKEEAIIYLKGKYGSEDFEVIDIDTKYLENGFVSTGVISHYDITAIYIPDNIKFHIMIGVNSSITIEDELIREYVRIYFQDKDFQNDVNKSKEQLIEYLRTKQIKVDIVVSKYPTLITNEILPNDYGKIPSKEEIYNLILDYQIKHEMKLIIYENEIKSDDIRSELKQYLIELSNQLINYYDNLSDYQITCTYDGGKGNYFHGTISINEDYINIYVGSIVVIRKR